MGNNTKQKNKQDAGQAGRKQLKAKPLAEGILTKGMEALAGKVKKNAALILYGKCPHPHGDGSFEVLWKSPSLSEELCAEIIRKTGVPNMATKGLEILLSSRVKNRELVGTAIPKFEEKYLSDVEGTVKVGNGIRIVKVSGTVKIPVSYTYEPATDHAPQILEELAEKHETTIICEIPTKVPVIKGKKVRSRLWGIPLPWKRTVLGVKEIEVNATVRVPATLVSKNIYQERQVMMGETVEGAEPGPATAIRYCVRVDQPCIMKLPIPMSYIIIAGESLRDEIEGHLRGGPPVTFTFFNVLFSEFLIENGFFYTANMPTSRDGHLLILNVDELRKEEPNERKFWEKLSHIVNWDSWKYSIRYSP